MSSGVQRLRGGARERRVLLDPGVGREVVGCQVRFSAGSGPLPGLNFHNSFMATVPESQANFIYYVKRAIFLVL